jgi:hypothetical protein
MTDLFSDDVVSAVVRHMNTDHAEDSLLICRTLGGQPTADAASTVGLDPVHVVFTASVDGRDVEVRVPWSKPITERVHFREGIVEMYRAACQQAGITPRESHG